MLDPIPDDKPFALCLTHDIDRPYKQWQAPYYLLIDRDHHHIKDLHPNINSWWQFDRIQRIEENLGVRSAFYFLQEPHLLLDRSPVEWTKLRHWIEFLGRYEISDPNIINVIKELDEGGWEIGVHGSIGSHTSADRLYREKHRIEDLINQSVIGIRQHNLKFERPETWRCQQAAGLKYDTSLGSASTVGFKYGYNPIRPFDDEFMAFPTTIMDKALDHVTDSIEDAWAICESLLAEAREHGAVMTILWHLRNFCKRDYPGFADLYRRLIDRALEMDAWVGPPNQLYTQINPKKEA